jgi:hypothetical protein
MTTSARKWLSRTVAALVLLGTVAAASPAFAGGFPANPGWSYDRAASNVRKWGCKLAAAAAGGGAKGTAEGGMSGGKPAAKGSVGAVVALVVFSLVDSACQK